MTDEEKPSTPDGEQPGDPGSAARADDAKAQPEPSAEPEVTAGPSNGATEAPGKPTDPRNEERVTTDPPVSPTEQAVAEVKGEAGLANDKGQRRPDEPGGSDDEDRVDRVPEERRSRTTGSETLAKATAKRGIISTGANATNTYYEFHTHETSTN